jgi:hypothetical protein
MASGMNGTGFSGLMPRTAETAHKSKTVRRPHRKSSRRKGVCGICHGIVRRYEFTRVHIVTEFKIESTWTPAPISTR